MKELVTFRWIAIICLFIGLAPLLGWGYLDKRHLPYMIAVLTLLMIFNFFAKTSLLKNSKSLHTYSDYSVLFHLLIDVLAAAGVLFVSGSAENPFIAILAIHGFLGGMLLSTRPSLIFFGLTCVVLALLQTETLLTGEKTIGFETSPIAMNFLAQWSLLCASWLVSRYFSNALKKKNQLIQSLREKQHLSDKSKSLGALAAGLSHEFASPLNALELRINRFNKVFEKDIQPLTSPETLEKAQKELFAARTALDSCLKIFAQMKQVFSGKVDLEFQKIEVISFIQKLLKHWQLTHPQIEVQFFPEKKELFVSSQPLALSESLLDVLDNASEAMNFQGELVLRIFREHGFVCIQICDQGIGLSEEIRERLGEPFVTSKDQGNGLGVYSVRLFAESHGGTFTLENNTTRSGVKATLSLLEEVSP